MARTLVYIPSGHIVEYIARNPIDWDKKDRAALGGPGDQAGIPPTPAVEEFLNLLTERRALFTQEEYMEYCWKKWRDWIKDKPKIQKYGVKAKLYRNFYPAMIDSLHVWALLCESGVFESCFLDSYEDAVSKTDITVVHKERQIKIGIRGPGTNANQIATAHKKEHRSNGHTPDVELVMPFHYEMSPGNKRWFRTIDVLGLALAPITNNILVANGVAP